MCCGMRPRSLVDTQIPAEEKVEEDLQPQQVAENSARIVGRL